MKSNLRNEIKAYIVRSGCTMQEVVALQTDEHGGSVPRRAHGTLQPFGMKVL